jgi:hypothetical protein
MTRGRSTLLWPREHGTYGELLFPLATALIHGRPGLVAWGLCAIALGGFLAHEGLVVAMGRRGDRARREDGPRARRSLLCFGGVAIAGAAVALPALETSTAIAAAVAMALACVAIGTAWLGAERRVTGKLIAAVALSAWCAPVALASGLPIPAAYGLWLIWFVAFALGTAAVESVMARSARRSPRPAQLLCAGLAMIGNGGLIASTRYGLLPAAVATTLIPMSLAALLIASTSIPARRMRAIGWSIVALSVVTMALMLWAFSSPR